MAYWKTTPRHTKREAMYVTSPKLKYRSRATRLIISYLANAMSLPDKESNKIARFIFTLRKWKVITHVITPLKMSRILSYCDPKFQWARKFTRFGVKQQMDSFMNNCRHKLVCGKNR